MMKKHLVLSLTLFAASWLTGCDESSSSDPTTVGKADLNPPRGLHTVTGDGELSLRFLTANAEEDFQGYHVFGAEYVESSFTLPAYPSGITAANLFQKSIPRCDKNDAFFAQFGLQATKTECEASGTADSSAEELTGASFITDETSTDASEDEALKGIIKCETGSKVGDSAVEGTEKISLPITKLSLDENVCIVKEVQGTALANGTTYIFFAVAVKGEEFNEISWTSNFTKDTPAVQIFSDSLTLKVGKAFYLESSKLGAAGGAVAAFGDDFLGLATFDAITTSDFTETDCQSSFCSVVGTNTASGTTDGIYIGRLGTGSFPQRLLFSAPSGGAISYQLRGPITYDPQQGADVIATSTPGDAAATTGYDTAGTTIPIYGSQVFDLKVRNTDGKDYYGKVVFEEPQLATATDGESDVTVKLTILMQPTAGVTDYLH